MILIAAIGTNGVIGYNGDLPWHIPDELRAFHAITEGGLLIMGRITYESTMGNIRDREIVVMTHNKDYPAKEQPLNVQCYNNDIQLFRRIREVEKVEDRVYLCGGESIYRQYAKYCSNLIISIIFDEPDGDRMFPVMLNKKNGFERLHQLNLHRDFITHYWENLKVEPLPV